MNDGPSNNERPKGLGALPRPWAVAARLVGTFGLAVFLVLYYVLVIQPQEAARYDRLRDSVQSLITVVEKGHSLVTQNQAARLEDLYLSAVAGDMAIIVSEGIDKQQSAEEIRTKLRQAMLARTGPLQGLKRKEGKVLSEMVTYQVLEFDKIASANLIEMALKEWKDLSVRQIRRRCEEGLNLEFHAYQRAK